MHELKQLAGDCSWQITKKPCCGVKHEYSNKWSPTMGLPNAKSLREERGLNFAVHGRVNEVTTLSDPHIWEVLEPDPSYWLGWVRELRVSHSGRTPEYQSSDSNFTLPKIPRGFKSPSDWWLVSIKTKTVERLSRKSFEECPTIDASTL